MPLEGRSKLRLLSRENTDVAIGTVKWFNVARDMASFSPRTAGRACSSTYNRVMRSVLDLDPVRRAAAAVGAVTMLRNQPLESHQAGMSE